MSGGRLNNIQTSDACPHKEIFQALTLETGSRTLSVGTMVPETSPFYETLGYKGSQTI